MTTTDDNQDSLPPIDYKNWREQFAGVEVKKHGRTTRLSEEVWSKYLEYLARWGKKGLAAQAAGVSYTAMQDFREENLAFAAAEQAVLEMRSERIAQQLEKEAMEGSVAFTYDKEGNIINERKVLETPLRLAMLKRHGEGYVDKSEVDVTTKGAPVGAVVVPAGVPAEDWERLYGEKAKGTYEPPTEKTES